MHKLILLIILIGAIFGVFLAAKKPVSDVNNETANPSSASVLSPLPNSKTYVNTKYGYEIKIPEGFKTEENQPESLMILPSREPEGMGPANFIYVSIIPQDKKSSEGEIYNYSAGHYTKLNSIQKLGDKISLSEASIPELTQWFEYTLTAYETISGIQFKRFDNNKPWEFPAGTTESRYLGEKDNKIYVLGHYTGGENVSARIDPRVAEAVIKSFQTKY